MKHRINGCLINLRGLTDTELSTLIGGTETRLDAVQEELDSLRGELVRRSSSVHPLRPSYEGPSVA